MPIQISWQGATLGANTFTGAQVAPSLALGGATIGTNALAVTGTTALGGSLLMGASTSITVASGGIVGVGFALDQQAAGDISTKAAGRIGFSSTSNPSTAPDSAFSRISAGIIGVGTGAAGSIAGSMQMSVLDFGTAGNAGVKWGASSLGLFNNSNNVLAVRNSTNSADANITANAATFSGVLGVSNGTVGAPSIYPAVAANTGIWWRNAASLNLSFSGTMRYEFGSGGDINVGGSGGVGLFMNGVNAQTANDAGLSRISAGIIGVGTGAAGNVAGGLRAATLALGGATIGSNALAVTGTAAVTGSGSFSGGLSVGTTGVTAAGDVGVTGKIYAIGATQLLLQGGDGIALFRNSAGTDFSRLMFGGTTSSYPSIKRNATALNFRLADDSADAPITAYSLVLSSTGNNISTLAGPLSLLATGGNLYFGGGGQGLLVSVGAGLGDGLIGYRAAAIVGFSSTALSYNAPDVAIARNGAGILEINNGTAGSFAGLKAAAATFSGAVTVPGVTTAALTSTGTFTSGAAAQVGTLTNAPAAGNPTTWIKIIDNGVTRYIPAW